MGQLRFALIGTGNIALQHAKAVLSCGCDLVGVCNHNEDKAVAFLTEIHAFAAAKRAEEAAEMAAAAAVAASAAASGDVAGAAAAAEDAAAAEAGLGDAVRWGDAAAPVVGETVFTSVDAMLDMVKPDVVYITTPHITHVDMAFAAVRRGIHCIIEKPLDISLAKARYLKEAAEHYGALVSVVAQSRFFPAAERMMNVISDGRLGTPELGIVHALSWRDEAYYKSNSWRGTWEKEGGGVLVNQAVHELDLLCSFLGEVSSVYGIWRNINHPYIEVDDTAQAIVTFKSGATANIIVSNSVNPAQNAYVHIIGSNGHSIGIMTHSGTEANAGLQPSTFRPCNDVFTLISDEVMASYRAHDYEDISDEEWPYYYFAAQIKEMMIAIAHKKCGMNVRIRNNIASAMGCMMIFTGIYLSRKLDRPVSAEEILEYSGSLINSDEHLATAEDGTPDIDEEVAARAAKAAAEAEAAAAKAKAKVEAEPEANPETESIPAEAAAVGACEATADTAVAPLSATPTEAEAPAPAEPAAVPAPVAEHAPVAAAPAAAEAAPSEVKVRI